eukprot:scaffold112016_cov27-Prasinocladus_malaysianus.AAC.1
MSAVAGTSMYLVRQFELLLSLTSLHVEIFAPTAGHLFILVVASNHCCGGHRWEDIDLATMADVGDVYINTGEMGLGMLSQKWHIGMNISISSTDSK